jgi:hypothetical protein
MACKSFAGRLYKRVNDDWTQSRPGAAGGPWRLDPSNPLLANAAAWVSYRPVASGLVMSSPPGGLLPLRRL